MSTPGWNAKCATRSAKAAQKISATNATKTVRNTSSKSGVGLSPAMAGEETGGSGGVRCSCDVGSMKCKMAGEGRSTTIYNKLAAKRVKGQHLKHWKPKFAAPFIVPRYKEKVARTLMQSRFSQTKKLTCSRFPTKLCI